MKIEWKAFHRRARRDDSSFFFAAETAAKKNSHALRARPDKLREALGLSLFCRPPPRGMGGAYSFGVSRKGKNVFLCLPR